MLALLNITPTSIPLRTILGLVLIYAVQSCIRRYLSARRFRQFASSNNCEPPHIIPNRFPWGIGEIIKVIGFKGDIIDDIICPAWNKGGNTHAASSILGQVINTCEPRNVQAILATNFKDYVIGDMRYRQAGILLGRGILTSDGARWAHSRALIRPQFNRDSISDLDVAERHVQALFEALSKSQDDEEISVDLEPLLFHYTLDMITEFLFGISVNSQQAAMENIDFLDEMLKKDSQKTEMSFSQAFTIAAETLGQRPRILGLNWLLDSKKFLEACSILRRFTDHFITLTLRHNEERAEDFKSDKQPKKQKYIFLEELSKETQDPQELRDQLLTLLLAGRDTTAALLSFVFIELARNPHVWKKVRQEVLETFGSENSPEITFSSLKGCHGVQHVLNETLRLYPLVPFNMRYAVEDTILPVGGGPQGNAPVAVRKGTMVSYGVFLMHRRKDIWGDDALEWKPERWVKKTVGWEYAPFNGGPRICLARRFFLHDVFLLCLGVFPGSLFFFFFFFFWD